MAEFFGKGVSKNLMVRIDGIEVTVLEAIPPAKLEDIKAAVDSVLAFLGGK